MFRDPIRLLPLLATLVVSACSDQAPTPTAAAPDALTTAEHRKVETDGYALTYSYPIEVRATLIELNGVWCGNLQHRLLWVDAVNPPYYRKSGTGDFNSATLTRVSDGAGGYTWELTILRLSGICFGSNKFRRAPAADYPAGDYSRYSSGVLDPSAGRASVTEVS